MRKLIFYFSNVIRLGFSLEFPDYDYQKFLEVEFGPFSLTAAFKTPDRRGRPYGKIDLGVNIVFWLFGLTLRVFKFWQDPWVGNAENPTNTQ
jgi:hypothetical protein